MKTTKTYESDIRQKYLDDEKSNQLRGDLYNLTRKNIKNVCLNLIDEGLITEDRQIMKNYFKPKLDENLREKVEKYDIESFRPIYNFLRGETSTIQSATAIDLMALVLDFTPRPYYNYRNDNLSIDGEIKAIEEVIESDSVTYTSDSDNGTSIIKVKPKNKKLFVWFSNASALNKIIIVGVVFIATTVLIANYVLNDRMKWMVWQEDHYEEVRFDLDKYDVSQLKLYKEERIEKFRKIEPDCSYKFFKADGSVKVWYGRNIGKELEFFTDLGLHPETGKTLKPITQYMIDKYICKRE